MTEARNPEAMLAELFGQAVTIEGRSMSMREAYIRALHQKAVAGDVESHVELDRLRRACGANHSVAVGYLVVPKALPLEEWERVAAEQQRPFRENPDGGTS